MPIHLLGIRHHGPGSARQVLARLEQIQPDLILVEGPPELEAILSWVGNKDLKPPVAALCYDEQDPARAVFYPFGEFSPEWQAIKFAQKQQIRVQCLDLPLYLSWQREKKEESEDGSELEQGVEAKKPFQGNPLDQLARIAGYEDTDLWWEHLFEHQSSVQDSEAHFEAVLLGMKTLRDAGLTSALDEENLFREAWMGQIIRQMQNELYQNIAVVCGAWHAPALLDLDQTEKAHAKIIKSLPKSKIKVGVTWIPWTNDRLSYQSGYGAGIQSPGWYRHLWKYPNDVKGERWLVKVAQLFRTRQMDTSTAHVIESVRMAEALASLRELPKPGLAELNESIRTVMCMGDDILLELVRQELIVGNAMGKVPKALPKLPLQADFEEKCRKLKMAQSAENKDLVLDLRKELDLNRSIFLHRLLILNIVWGKLMSVRGKGSFKEAWRLKWKPEMLVSLIEKGIWGNKVEDAASKFLLNKSENSQSIGDLSEWINMAIPAELFGVIELLLQKINDLAALSHEIMDLMRAVSPLAEVGRYGNVRKSDLSAINGLVEGLTIRISIGLPGACYGLDDASAFSMFELIRKVNDSVRLVEQEELTAYWQQALMEISAKPHGIAPVIGGCTTRLLFDAKIIENEVAAQRFSQALSTGNEPAHAAAWLEGFLKGSGAILLYDDTLWALLYQWVEQLTEDTFMHLAPILRRTFSKFEPAERKKIGEKAKHGLNGPSGSSASSQTLQQLDLELAKKPMALLRLLLGANTG